MPKFPTVAVAGLWSAITVAVLTAFMLEQSQPVSSADTKTAPVIVQANHTTEAAIILTDATGNRYRTRRD